MSRFQSLLIFSNCAFSLVRHPASEPTAKKNSMQWRIGLSFIDEEKDSLPARERARATRGPIFPITHNKRGTAGNGIDTIGPGRSGQGLHVRVCSGLPL